MNVSATSGVLGIANQDKSALSWIAADDSHKSSSNHNFIMVT